MHLVCMWLKKATARLLREVKVNYVLSESNWEVHWNREDYRQKPQARLRQGCSHI